MKRGAILLDPASSGRLSDAHGGYFVDLKNYTDRWLCLANLIEPQAERNCYNSYPAEWMTLPEEATQPALPAAGVSVRRAPLFKPEYTPLQGLFKAKSSG